jgi:hypothetical protein
MQRQSHILKYGTIEQQLMVLEHHTDLATVVGNLALTKTVKVTSGDDHLTGGGALHQHNELHQRTFTRARMTSKKHQLTVVNIERQVAQCLMAVFIAFTDVAKIDHKLLLF